jgi:hypothetical protein
VVETTRNLEDLDVKRVGFELLLVFAGWDAKLALTVVAPDVDFSFHNLNCLIINSNSYL